MLGSLKVTEFATNAAGQPDTMCLVPPGSLGTPAAGGPPPVAISVTPVFVDARSEKTISTLLPELHSLARQLVQDAADEGITIKIISGLRTYDEQNSLYAQGRTASGNVVTNAKGGYSNHNFGIAFDIGVFENGKYLGNSPSYRVVGPIGTALGLEWGGNWKTFVDLPHYQLRPSWAANMSESEMLRHLRDRKDKSLPVF
jgi:peptidoglycan L-alanyl-D-glutamate endopeptidase CwlK